MNFHFVGETLMHGVTFLIINAFARLHNYPHPQMCDGSSVQVPQHAAMQTYIYVNGCLISGAAAQLAVATVAHMHEGAC